MKLKVTNKNIVFLLTFYFIHELSYLQASAYETSQHSCISNKGTKGTCVEFGQCKSIQNLDQRPLQGLAAIWNSTCSLGLFKIGVCCPREENNSIVQEARDVRVEKTVSEATKWLYPPYCGSSISIHDRVVGGSPSELGAWPWIAALAIRFGPGADDIEFLCGGTLVSSKHIVTAAHCLEFEDVTYFVRLGEIDLASTRDGAYPVDVEVEKIIIHPNHNEKTKENDIAVLRLKNDVTFDDLIHPICLPLKPEIRNRNFYRTFPFVAGWGSTAYNDSSNTILREVQVPVVETDKCKKTYKKKNVVIDNRTMCAGFPNGGKDACQGDSGGPLMFPEQRYFYLIGVVSVGFRCAAPGYPGIYTRVTEFLSFIISNMK